MKETDIGNAEYLHALLGGDFHYCESDSDWYAWDGTRWRSHAHSLIYARAKEVLDLLHAEADASGNKSAKRWADSSESLYRIRAMLELVRWEPGILIKQSDFNCDGWLLNVANGTVDLRTGHLLRHARADLVANLINVRFDPAAECPRWERYLREIFQSEPDLPPFIQRAIGYSLTGDMREQVLFFLYGDGKNGKSKFLNILHSLLGPYAHHCQSRTLMAASDGTADYDIARMSGTRLVTAVESRKGVAWNEELIKQLTGDDAVITARFPYGRPFEFRPHWKIWFSSNYLPSIAGNDFAIWRRILLVRFLERFDGAREDKELESKLSAELPGILNWALRGTAQWLSDGLAAPACVLSAVEEYRRKMDVLGPFMEDVAVVHPHMTVAVGEFYAAYVRWAERNAATPIGKLEFGHIIAGKKGVTQVRKSAARYWLGIGIGSALATASLSQFSDTDEEEADQ